MEKGYIGIAWELWSVIILTAQSLFNPREPHKDIEYELSLKEKDWGVRHKLQQIYIYFVSDDKDSQSWVMK